MKKIMLIMLVGQLLTACVSTKNIPLEAKKLEASSPAAIVIAKRNKPDFSAMTAGKAAFGMLGAAAMISAGNKIVEENNVEDPASYIADEVSMLLLEKLDIASMTKSEKITIATKASKIVSDYPGDNLIVDVQTVNWSFVYFPSDWDNYRVMYSAKLRVINGSTSELLAEGFCSRVPEKDQNSPTKDQLLENSAQRLKDELKLGAEACIDQFKKNVLAFN